MNWLKQPRVKDRKYLDWVATLPCLCCIVCPTTAISNNDVVSHHIMKTGLRGIGIKSPDNYCIPLCHIHHFHLHMNKKGESNYLLDFGITNQIEIANRLYEIYLENDNRDDKAITLLITREL